MDIMNSTTNATHTSAITGGSFNRLFFKILVFLLGSSVFWVAISVAVLIHFILEYVFRPRKNESQPVFCPEIENIRDKDRFTGFDYLWEHSHDTFWNNITENYSVNVPKSTDELAEINSIQGSKYHDYEESQKLTSSLSFKFEHQALEEFCEPQMHSVKEDKSLGLTESPIPDEPSITDEPSTTRIQKYQFAPEKNLRGFVAQPETMTISVNDFSTELKVDKFASKEEGQNINQEDEKIGEVQKLQQVLELETNSDIMQNSESESELGIETKFHPEIKLKVQMALKDDSLPELISDGEPAQVVTTLEFLKSQPKPKAEPKLEHVSAHEPEPEPEPQPEQEHEPEPEQEPELELELEQESDPEPEHGLKPEPLDGVRRDIKAMSERDFSESSDRELGSEIKPENTYYKESKEPTYSSAHIPSSIDDVIMESVIKTSKSGSFNPINELNVLENVPSGSEIPLEMPKRPSNKRAPVQKRRKQVRKKRSIQKEMLSEKTKSNSSSSSPSTVLSTERGRQMLSRRHASGEFSGFDSDSQSSVSDGYSVKDLVMDSDNDWFLSEKEYDNSPQKTCCTEESTNLMRYTFKLMDHPKELEKSEAQSFYGSETDLSNYPVQITHQPNELNMWLKNHSKPEFDMLPHEEKEETKVSDESEGVKSQEIGVLNETHIEINRSFQEMTKIVKEDASKETQTTIFSQEDEAKIGFSEREPHTETSKNYEAISPRNDSATENPRQDSKNIDVHQSKLKEKCNEYVDEEEEDELESLWEHQDLIEQLKMEIKKARATGLPTILEESETPKTTMEELKAWHFDEKFLREDPMDELNKFYKSYRERMRKFDILNYQKMYAVGFLNLKDPLESMGSQKPLLPTITSILTQNLHRRRKSTNDPSERFIKELRCDLEMVYVGQICLSWEFLRWQYEKALEMPDSDPYHSHRYNQAAGEFQQFQVLVNRFIENEPFQGPRLPNYVKNRCVLRHLLQVPVIKEDNLKDKLEDNQKGNSIITSEELEDTMEESIRVFWEFVKADKNETPVIMKGLVGPQVELQDPSDYNFMMRLHSILQKKDRRLKDLLKTGNCLIKKFKKPKEDRSNQDLFFSQVDIKLVSRVLKMPKITSEQLQWCHEKLDKISFVGRKVQREPSFLLFPC